ncbi:MAG: hypothetical protein Q9202_004671 [Teloschistes flavicans]
MTGEVDKTQAATLVMAIATAISRLQKSQRSTRNIQVHTFQVSSMEELACTRINYRAMNVASFGKTDVIILVLPMPIIWRLQVPLRNKFILSLIFGFGFFICIISIIRLRTLLTYTTAPMMVLYDSDGLYHNNLPILYTIVESSLGIICACLVLMKPLFTHWKPSKSIKSRFSSLLASRDSAVSSSSNGGSGKLSSGVADGREIGRQAESLGPRSRDTSTLQNDERELTFMDLEAAEYSEMIHVEKERPPQWGGIQQTRDIEISYE